MAAPRLIALNKLGEIRNQDPTLYQVIQELQNQMNGYILDQANRPVVVAPAASSVLFAQTADGPTLTNTTTETDILGAGIGSLAIPANTFTAGKSLRVNVRGFINSTNSHGIKFRFKLNSTISDGMSGFTTITSIASAPFELNLLATCRTAGASGVLMGVGVGNYAAGLVLFPFNQLSTVTLNTTIIQTVSVTATWAVGVDSGDVLMASACIVEVL